jgi:hypothetical protein
MLIVYGLEKTTVMQLLIGTSDGSLYQVSCDKKADMPWVALAPKHVCAPIGSNLLDAYIIDLQGQEQTPYFVPMASQETIGSPAVSETTTDSITSQFSPPVEMPEEDTGTTDNGSGFLKRSLTRKQSKKSSPTSPRRTKSVHDSSESPKMSRSRVQKNPHLCILVTETGVQVHLNVSQLKLFAIKVSELFENQSTIVRANLVRRLGKRLICAFDVFQMIKRGSVLNPFSFHCYRIRRSMLCTFKWNIGIA